MTLSPSVFSLEQEINNLINIFMPQADEKYQTFNCHSSGIEGLNLFTDKLRLNQIMMNLISNAIKYTPEHGNIDVNISCTRYENCDDKVHLIFQVKDNGIGMAEEYQKNMYSSFTRENTEPQKQIQGSGLGLAICRQMVKMLDGTIECDSILGKGTTFTVSLDISAANEAAATEDNSAQNKILTREELKGIRILIAEDNELNWEIAKEIMDTYYRTEWLQGIWCLYRI